MVEILSKYNPTSTLTDSINEFNRLYLKRLLKEWNREDEATNNYLPDTEEDIQVSCYLQTFLGFYSSKRPVVYVKVKFSLNKN